MESVLVGLPWEGLRVSVWEALVEGEEVALLPDGLSVLEAVGLKVSETERGDVGPVPDRVCVTA